MEEPKSPEWVEPPPPADIKKIEEPPRMSELATLGNIFFEPGNTFEDLRRKPRFILALLIMIFITAAYFVTFQKRMGEQRYRQFFVEQIDKSPQAQGLSAEQKQQQIDFSLAITKYIGYVLPVFLVIFTFIGALIYWLGIKAFGGIGTYMQAVSVYVYSSFAPAVISLLANFLVLFLKSPDDIDIATSSRGVIQASPAMFMNGREMPVLTTLAGTFDFFIIWGLILAAIGLNKVGKISKGSAWTIVLFLTLLSLTYRIISAFLSGNPQ